MKLATFKANGRTSYGAVTDGGIIDLGRKLSKYPTLLDLLRAQAIAEAGAAAKGTADYQVKDVEMLPPIPAPDKNICVGINYPDRNAEYKDGREAPKYPNLFCRFPDLPGGDRSAHHPAEGFRQVRLRRRDRARDRKRRPPRSS